MYTRCIHDSAMVLDDHCWLTALVDFPDFDDSFNPRHAEQVPKALSDIVTDTCAGTRRPVLDHMSMLDKTA